MKKVLLFAFAPVILFLVVVLVAGIVMSPPVQHFLLERDRRLHPEFHKPAVAEKPEGPAPSSQVWRCKDALKQYTAAHEDWLDGDADAGRVMNAWHEAHKECK